MTKDDFTAIAYSYFPKGVDNLLDYEGYINSLEFRKLSNHCNVLLQKEEAGEFDEFYSSIKLLDTSKNFHIVNLFHVGDRAFNLQLAELKGSKHYSICLNVSTIVPYYTVYVLETDVSHALVPPVDFLRPGYKLPVRNREMEQYYAQILQSMALIVESTFGVKQFPENLLDAIIPDISFDTVGFGTFTFFNAFFLDQYQYRL